MRHRFKIMTVILSVTYHITGIVHNLMAMSGTLL
jgi:hypothetical protein